MKFSLRSLVAFVAIFSVLVCWVASWCQPVQLTLDMAQEDFETALLRLNAEDISPGMSVGTFDGDAEDDSPVGWGGIWHIASANITIEASFEDQKLKTLNLWDWAGRSRDRYHHVLEFDRVSSLTISVLQPQYSADRIETVNARVNPPARTSLSKSGR